MRSNAKVFYDGDFLTILQQMQRNLGKLLGKKLLPPNFRLLFLLSQFIFLATVRRKMNWKRCIFPASQIVFIMASIMWKVLSSIE